MISFIEHCIKAAFIWFLIVFAVCFAYETAVDWAKWYHDRQYSRLKSRIRRLEHWHEQHP